MLLTVTYSPELNIYTTRSGHTERIVTPDELEEGGRYNPCRQIFDNARRAVTEGRAVAGVCVEL